MYIAIQYTHETCPGALYIGVHLPTIKMLGGCCTDFQLVRNVETTVLDRFEKTPSFQLERHGVRACTPASSTGWKPAPMRCTLVYICSLESPLLTRIPAVKKCRNKEAQYA
jgi:hypothetical protein